MPAGESTARESTAGGSTARPAPRQTRWRALADLPPGPGEARASLLGRFLADPERVLSECHERFGDCFTLPLPGFRNRSRPVVVLSDPDAIRQLFAGRPALSTPARARQVANSLGQTSTFLLDEDAYVERRRILSAHFHGELLRRWRGLAAEIAEREVASWPLDEPLELGPRLYGVALEVILQAVLGGIADDRLSELRILIRRICNSEGPRTLRTHEAEPEVAPRDAVDELLTAELRERRESSADGDADVLAMLLGPIARQGTLSDVELCDELMSLMLAGHETVAVGLAWTFELLMRNPDALGRARRDAIDGDGTYVAAVVKEALRCKPPVPLLNRTLREPWETAGHRLPAGTDIAPCIYLVHQRPELYPEPERFLPERFLDSDPPRFGWLTFGTGVRRCLGAAFAEIEMREVLRAVLTRAEPELPEPGPVPHGTWRTILLRPSGTTRAVLRSRAPDEDILMSRAGGS
jgi:cytochrome P450